MTQDPLRICNPRLSCTDCGGNRRKRKNCDRCEGDGYERADLSGLWSRPSFLVCGGPSLNTLDLSRLRDRGIVSLAINNAAGHAPVDAWCFSDPQKKFHSGLFFDPKLMTFAPTPKCRRGVRVKTDQGFQMSGVKVQDCPNTWGFSRSGRLHPDNFFGTPYAQWGYGGRQDRDQQPFRRLATMLLGIRLLHYLGSRIIYMLGVDFWIDKEQPYAWGQDKGGGNRAWVKIAGMLRDIEPSLKQAGVQLYNCNPKSQLELYEHVPYDVALEVCRGTNVPKGPFDLEGWYNKS